ncbi:glycosyltransferase family 4 protein [Providencia rettgeri]|uniref:glycosyltransferase family 4 protein n=1 Tax=Providencia sp. PROV272 TaxID=2936800 RepID=UPI0034E6A24A
MNRKALIVTDIQNAMIAGGVKLHTRQLITFLQKNSFDVELFIESIHQDKSYFSDLVPEDKIIITNHRGKYFRNNIIGVFYDKYLTRKIKRKNFSIVIINTGDISKYWGFSMKNSKNIHILHSLFTKKISIKNMFFVNNIKNKKIITVSNYAKKLLMKNTSIISSNINVVYNHTMHSSCHKTNFKKNNEIIILSVGQRVKYKGIYDWLEVSKKIIALRNNVKFIWLGDGPIQLDLSESEQKKIHLAGYKKDLSEYYSTSDIYYHPSHIENHSLSILEAMSFKLPIVACDTGGNSESINNNISGLIVQKSNIDEHVTTLLKLIDNKILRDSLADNAYHTYIKKFSLPSWEKNMIKTLEL